MDTKSLGHVEIKDASRGEVTAVFATLNAIDHDGDVTLPGAFAPGEQVRISAYGHQSWGGALPVGKGVIREDGDAAILEGQFFMDTVAGADTFTVVKELAGLQEWSYGYDVIDAEPGYRDERPVRMLKRLKVHEVSPVMLGAGIGTRTLAVKSAKNMTFVEEATSVLADVSGLLDRADEVVALRAEKGKGLSPASASLLEQVDEGMTRLKSLLTTTPEPAGQGDEALREYLRYVARKL